jgi:hypothetical protein
MAHARNIEKGLLPYAGGLFEQPAKLMELVSFINGLRTEDELARAKAASDKAKKDSRKRGR